jgi:LCP family protein required for cell wall assembly
MLSVFFSPSPQTDQIDPDAQAPASPPHRPRWLLRALVLVAVLVVVVGTATGIYAGWVSRSFTRNLHHEDLLPVADTALVPARPSAPPRPTKGSTRAVDYVLMGSDSRDPEDAAAGRSDTLMVLHLDADRRAAYLVSFPRDMYVAIPGYGKNKINAAYSFGGVPLAVETVEQLLDTRMDHVAVIDFDGFIDLTTQLGGVRVHNEHASRSRGYTFPRGTITVKGDEALAFVRERYDLPNGDLDRAERQRLVVQAILAKAMSRDVVTDPGELARFVSGVARNVTVDSSLSSAEIRQTALSLRLGADDVKLLQAPITGFATAKGQSIDVVDHDRLKDLGEALRDDRMGDYLKQHPSR